MCIPPNKIEIIPKSHNTLEYLLKYFKNQLKKLENLGFKKNNIIIDPGIGFGKDSYQNIEILKNLDILKKLGCEIMIGHSRKSYIQALSGENDASNGDIEVIAIFFSISKFNIDLLRIHDVKNYMKAYFFLFFNISLEIH
jgi:2-amino-4-hydroxy-6-hydroxymethyldihydropteridine diphosphokinase/dihydropteroate synthase